MTIIEGTRETSIRTSVTDIGSARLAWITVLLLFFGWLIDYVDRLIITLALPMIGHDFSLNKAEQGLIVTVFFITYAAAQLPGGLLADRIGSRRTLTLALGSWSFFTVLTGIVTSYGLLLVVRAAFGVSGGYVSRGVDEGGRRTHHAAAAHDGERADVLLQFPRCGYRPADRRAGPDLDRLA